MDKTLSFRYISLILYTLYILVGFVPYFGSVDKTATQIVYVNILNCISLALVVGFYKQFERSFKFALSILPSILFFGYFIWGLLTYFLAFNQTEVLIESGKTFTYLSAFIFFVFLFKTNKSYFLKYFPIIISLILLTETSLVLLEFIDRYKENYTRTLGLRAFTGNINITAFIMVLQIPFYIYQAKKWKFLKIFFPVIFFTVILLGSRGANLSILLVLIIFVLLTFIKRFKVISKKNLVQIILSFVVAIGINNFLFDKNEDIKKGTSVSYIDRTTNLNTSSTQQRLRFYGDAIQSIKKNFFFGIGLGNWKIESIIYDKPHMKGYKVPYHVHNDFLEVFSETGIIGFILYYGIAFIAIFIVWKKFSKKRLQTNNEFLIVISTSLLIFLIDSFNFSTILYLFILLIFV